MKKRIPIMKTVGNYINVYKPDDGWVANDFSILNNNGVWHMVGITQPNPEGVIYDFNYVTVHDNEHQLFHCTAQGETFADVFKPESFNDGDKLLPSAERPDEIPEIHAPHLIKHNGFYRMIYGPRDIRCADTADFKTWKRHCMFSGNGTLRDPFLYVEDGVYYLLDTDENRIVYRTSTDMIKWSEPMLMCKCPFDCVPESPFLFKRLEYYYLMWTIYDNRNGCYDERTYVFAAETLSGLNGTAPLTILDAHAPEYVSDASVTTF